MVVLISSVMYYGTKIWFTVLGGNNSTYEQAQRNIVVIAKSAIPILESNAVHFFVVLTKDTNTRKIVRNG